MPPPSAGSASYGVGLRPSASVLRFASDWPLRGHPPSASRACTRDEIVRLVDGWGSGGRSHAKRRTEATNGLQLVPDPGEKI